MWHAVGVRPREIAEQRRAARRVVHGGDELAREQRERNQPELNDVRRLRQQSAIAERHQPEFLPQSIRGHLQRIERRAEHVFGHHEPSIGCDDNALQCYRAVRDIARHAVKRGEHRRELANQLERERRTARILQHFRETPAGGVIRDERQFLAGPQPLDGPHASDGGIRKPFELLHTAPKRAFERRLMSELALEAQQFERRRGRVVEHQEPVAQSVRQPRGVPTRKARSPFNIGQGPLWQEVTIVSWVHGFL